MKKTIKNKKYYRQDGILAEIEKHFLLRRTFLPLLDCFFYVARKLISPKSKSGKIIIISLHRLGDTVFTIPALKEIFNKYKDSHKTILCYEESKNIYNIVFKEEIQTINKENIKFGGRFAGRKVRKILKNLDPELVFDLTGTVASASIIFNSRASKIAGMNERIFKNLYTDYIRRRKIPHLIDTYLDVAGLVADFERTEEAYQFKAFADGNGKILIHPFSVNKAKEWNLNKFISLAEMLSDVNQVEVIAPENSFPTDIMEEIVGKRIPVSITKNMDELISKIKECSVFISNDTGPLYIANLLGKPTFTIYGPTNPEFSLPFGKYHHYIQKKIECSPEPGRQYCYTLAGMYCPLYECMNQLSVDEVYSSVKSFINKINIKNKKSVA